MSWHILMNTSQKSIGIYWYEHQHKLYITLITVSTVLTFLNLNFYRKTITIIINHSPYVLKVWHLHPNISLSKHKNISKKIPLCWNLWQQSIILCTIHISFQNLHDVFHMQICKSDNINDLLFRSTSLILSSLVFINMWIHYKLFRLYKRIIRR